MKIPKELIAAQQLIYDKCNFQYTELLWEPESAEYDACTFQLNESTIKFRTAKITPTKIGQFVTLWKRNAQGPIEPFSISDPIDLFVISVKQNDLSGQFVFPKSILNEKDIVAGNNKKGKRAIRVYPPWHKAVSKQAQQTQAWQLKYFLEIPADASIDIQKAKKLYNFL